jgi:hypothetical protein
MHSKLDKKKIEILTVYPGYDGLVKKTISRYCPFKALGFKNKQKTCSSIGPPSRG